MANGSTKGKRLICTKAINTIKAYLNFHQMDKKLRAFEFILEKDYAYGLGLNVRGNSDILSPAESFKDDMFYYLNLIHFMYVKDEEKVIDYCWFDEQLQMFLYRQEKLIVIEQDNILIHGYTYEKNLHILKIEAKSKSLLNFKRIKKLLDKLKEQYKLLTAQAAKSGCNYIGKEKNWRFKKSKNNKTKLQNYWLRLGWVFEKDGFKMEY